MLSLCYYSTMDTTKHRALFWASAGAALLTLAVTIGLFWYHDFSPYAKIGGKNGIGPAVNTSGFTTSTSTIPLETKMVVFLGDSITAGYGLKSLNDAYPSIIERSLHESGFTNVTIINSGVSGDTTAGGLRRAPFIALQKPDIVVLALGGNDALRGIDPAATKSNLDATIQIFQERNFKVILVGMQAPDNLGAQYVKEFNAVYPELAVKHTLPFIPFLLQGVALKKELNQPDGIHPNAAGARIVANTMLPVLKRVLGVVK